MTTNNTPTPAQALGEVMALSEKAHAGELEAVMADGAVPCVGMVVADDSGGKGFLVAEGWSLDDCKFAAAAMNLVRQHGQHFAGLAERCREFEEIAALRKEAYELVHEACGEFKARAEAAEARVREAEGLLQKIDNLIPGETLGPELCEELDAFLAARG